MTHSAIRCRLILSSAAVIVLLVSGCNQSTRQHVGSQKPTVWARKDGQRISGNDALISQARQDERNCRSEAEKAALDAKSEAMRVCMDERGYELIPLPEGETFVPVEE